MLTQHGIEVIPLSKIVKELCLKQGNMKETNVFQQLIYARWAWKELFRKYIWQIKNQVLQVDCKDYTICLPDDCERLINIYAIDGQRKLQPLTCDPGINTVEINCIVPHCSCSNCKGEGTLCAAAESGITYTTEYITIHGTQYLKETWVRYDGNGAIQQQTKTPALNSANNSIQYVTDITTLCNIEVTSKGCIKPTPGNMELLNSFCGCNNFTPETTGYNRPWCRTAPGLIPQPYNFYGYWNVNAANPSTIHIFRNDNGYNLKPPSPERNIINQAIISYQTNGETPGDEILVPQYAQMAMETGIMWQQKLFNPKAAASDKEYAKTQWNAARLDVNKHLNPIRMEDVAKLQTQMRRW